MTIAASLRILVAACIAMLCATTATAGETTMWFMPGVASVVAREFVYIPSEHHKLSELIWRSEPMFTLNGGVVLQLRPRSKFRLSATAGFNGDSQMTDFDWQDLSTPHSWTDRSIHDVTKLPAHFEIDGRLSQDFGSGKNWILSGLAGIKYTQANWSAYGGKFTYSTFDDDGNLLGFRDDIFEIPARERGVSYRQQWLVPYIGLSAKWRKERSILSLSATASPLAYSWDRDIHWQRDLVFTEKFAPSWMLSADMQYDYMITTHAGLMLAAGMESYAKTRGRTKIVDKSSISPLSFGPKNGAGASMMNVHGSVGLRFDF
jgi:outer membrane protease